MNEDRLRKTKARWMGARKQTDHARYELELAIWAAADAGMTQSEVARILGWPRQRVNAVLKH